MPLPLHGGCFCGALRFEIAEVFDAGYCHCNRCRRRSGNPAFAFMVVPRDALRLVSGGLGEGPAGRLGADRFCAACGRLVLFEYADLSMVSLGIGLLDDPTKVRPTFHQCVADKLPGFEIGDDLPQFAGTAVSHPRERASPLVDG